MKRLFKSSITLLLALSMALGQNMVAFASESNSQEEHHVVEIEYVPYDFFYENSPSPDIRSDNELQSRVKYIVKNVKSTGETLGDTKYTSDEGVPGVSVGMNRSKSIFASCSVTGIPIIKVVSAKLGFSVTGSYSVGVSSSWTVPETVGRRKVKYGYIIARPVFDNWKYSVYIDSNRIDETFLMNGTAKKPRDRMRIEKVVVYQR